MKFYLSFLPGLLFSLSLHASDSATLEFTPYTEQKVVFEFYFDDPRKINTALYWIRAQQNTLNDEPYNIVPDLHDIKVIMHGTELVTVAKSNYEKYKEAVERMRYYTEFGVEFRVCGQALKDFGYDIDDLQDFIQVIPSAVPELVHWQQQGYALITPVVMDKKFSLDEIR